MAYKSKPKRRRLTDYYRVDHLIQGTGQTIQDPDSPTMQDVMAEAQEMVQDAQEITAGAAIANAGYTLPGAVMEERGAMDLSHEMMEIGNHNPRSSRHLAHRRGRHFLPLQPGILICR